MFLPLLNRDHPGISAGIEIPFLQLRQKLQNKVVFYQAAPKNSILPDQVVKNIILHHREPTQKGPILRHPTGTQYLTQIVSNIDFT